MNANPDFRLLNIAYIIAFCGFFLGINTEVSGQSQNFGDYQVQILPDWSYSGDKSSGDFYVFLNDQQKIEVALKKVAAQCMNPMEFTKVILPVIQNFQKEQKYCRRKENIFLPIWLKTRKAKKKK